MNGLEVGQRATDLWGKYSTKNKASTYLYCQSFAGYYVPWAVTGTEPAITYASARAAALASTVFTQDVNSVDVRPGDNVFFVWGSDWHVVNVIGRDSSGRTLVLDTANSGDVVRSLGRNVRIRHADTIPLPVHGVARTNGKQGRIAFDAWGGDESAQPASTGGGVTVANPEEVEYPEMFVANVKGSWYLVVPQGSGKPKAVVLGGDSGAATAGLPVLTFTWESSIAALKRAVEGL